MLTVYSDRIVYIITLSLVTELENTFHSPLKLETMGWQSYKHDKFKEIAITTSRLSKNTTWPSKVVGYCSKE